jgi:selenocysteine lyase/cysteine desulfurase
MYVKKDVGDKIKTVRVMADDNCDMPWKLETGTPAMELACGAAEAVEFIADLGARHAEFFEEELKGLTGRRRNVVAGMLAIDAVEESQAKKIRTELAAIPGLKIFGPPEGHPRTSTVSFLVEGINANDIAKSMAEDGIFVWDGDYYAIEIIMNVWKLGDVGGLVRIGLAPYNTDDEIDRIIQSVRDAVAKLRK